MTTDNRHKWECISPGEYDTTYKCSACGALFTDQADDPSSMIPEFGCINGKTEEECLAVYVRRELGQFNDEKQPVVLLVRDVARRLEEAQQKIVAQEAKDNYVGRWLSAALNDPSVCEEMKADIRLWMASDATAIAAHDNEIKAQALEEAADMLGNDQWHISVWIRAKAAEYRAKN